jgi:nitroreductase
MLEKGLTMQPRRDTFAVDFIETAVAAFINDEPRQDFTGLSEHDWAASVLDDYFEATKTSEAPQIVRARASYEAVRRALNIQPSGPHEAGTPNSPLTIEQLEKIAHDRRSVRWFLPEPVDSGIVDRAIRIALEAPTACNRQPYEFRVVTDPDSVAKVAEIPMGTAGYGQQLSGIVVIVGDLSAFFDERDRHLIYIDSCLAAMSFIMALQAQNVSSCCINWPDIRAREEAMAELLNLRPYQRVVMLVAFGYADPRGLVPRSVKGDLDGVRRAVTL